jgi:hypothetical protein
MRRSPSANGFPKSAGVGEAGRLVALPNQWEATGLECDKMSEEAVAFHLRHVIEELKKHLGPLVGTELQHMLLDSSRRRGNPIGRRSCRRSF